jgi:hypothetical protein
MPGLKTVFLVAAMVACPAAFAQPDANGKVVTPPGKTLEDNGKLRGKHPAGAFFDLLLEKHGQVSCMPFMMNEKDVQTLLRGPGYRTQ